MSIGDYARHAEIWDWYAADRTEEIRFWAALARRYGTKVLCGMCATGQVAAALAAEGLQVTGVDITPEMIAAAESQQAGQTGLQFVQGDLCALQLPSQDYDFAFVGTTSFHHLQTAEQREAALRSLWRHTRPGGGLALELWYPAERDWSSPERVFEPLHPTPGAALRVWKRGSTRYQADRRLVTIEQEVCIERNGASESFPHVFSLQLLDRQQLLAELERADYRLVREHGSYGDSTWQPGDPKWIIEAVRA